MPVKITGHQTQDQLVTDDVLINTIERNRDRVRTTASMVLTVSGIMISASVAFVLFTNDKKIGNALLSASFIVTATLFVVAAAASLFSTLLRTKVSMTSQSQFVLDLLGQYNRELRLLRIAIVPLLLGFLFMVIAVVLFSTEFWR